MAAGEPKMQRRENRGGAPDPIGYIVDLALFGCNAGCPKKSFLEADALLVPKNNIFSYEN